MVTDTLIPIYEVLVESVFGSVGLAIIGVAVALVLILLICRASTLFIVYWMLFYFMVMGTLYIGGVALAITFLFGFSMLVYQLIKYFGREG